jgi:hypothetical protein
VWRCGNKRRQEKDKEKRKIGRNRDKDRYLYKSRLRTDQASGDLMGVVASCFYKIVRDAFLEHLIRRFRKSRKPMNDRNARASDGHQEKVRKCTHGETLRRAL